MPRVIILRGVSGSGKSTAARQLLTEHGPNSVIVSRDILRQNFGLEGKGILTPAQEQEVTKMEIDQLRRSIVQDYTVIVDDTNLDPKTLGKLIDECHLYGVEPELIVVQASLEECLSRREGQVPEQVIRKQFNRGFPEPTVRVPLIEPLPDFDPHKPDCFIFDVDGTLAHSTGRNPYDLSMVHTDAKDETVSRLFYSLKSTGNTLLIVSGRGEESREATTEWLMNRGLRSSALYMRMEGDTRHDATVKYEIAQEIAKVYNIVGVIDDRSRVCRMWRSAGVKTLQVCDWIEGDF